MMTRRIVRRMAALLAVALSFAAPRLAAQDAPSLESKIRFRRDVSAEWTVGTLIRIAPDTFVTRVCDKCADSLFNVTPLSAFEIERQRYHIGKMKHILVGAGVGVLAGGAVLLEGIRRCEAENPHADGPPCGIAVVFLPAFALGGAAVGAVVGGFVPSAQWERLPSG